MNERRHSVANPNRPTFAAGGLSTANRPLSTYLIERLGDDPAAGEYAVVEANSMTVTPHGALVFTVGAEVVSAFNEWVEVHRADEWPKPLDCAHEWTTPDTLDRAPQA